MEVLNIRSALSMMDGDKELLKTLLESYTGTEILDEKKLLALESEEDTTEAGKYVHKFKGAGKQLGAEILGESAQNLEDVLKKRKVGDIKKLTENFIKDYKEAISAMKEALEIL